MGPSIDRNRSRSPYRSAESPRKRKRSRSPHRHRSEHKSKASSTLIALPLGAQSLTRHDLTTYRPMFALYLDIQKQKDIEGLPEDEVKGRWKSFMGKWNRAELAEGWYDPKTLQKARDAVDGEEAVPKWKSSPDYIRKSLRSGGRPAGGSDEDSDFGPSPPADMIHTGPNGKRVGPTIPRLDDLQIQKELLDEGLSKERRQELEDLRAARKADRKTQLARLDELAPKAEPGTRERQLEKKKEKAASNKAFAEGPDAELPDAEVMGGGDSLEELKRMKQANERKKTERELRREEVLRAKQAEREERVRGMRQKEDKTMAMLQEIAKARFGSGNDQHATLG